MLDYPSLLYFLITYGTKHSIALFGFFVFGSVPCLGSFRAKDKGIIREIVFVIMLSFGFAVNQLK